MIEHMFVSETDHVGELRKGLEALAGEDRSGWAAAALSELVVELAEVVERAEAELVRAVGEWDAVQAWALDGAVAAPSWLAARVPLTRQDAVGLCRTARLARRQERTGRALAAGDISVSHVTTMSRAERGRRDAFADDEDMVLDVAPELRPTEFVTAMQHWCHVVDDDRRTRDPNAKFDQRFLDLNRTFDGHSNVDGFLDQEAAALLERALAKIMGPPDPRTGLLAPRTARQRRADALVDMARESLAHASPGGHVPAHVAAVLHVNDALDRHDHDHDGDTAAPTLLRVRIATGRSDGARCSGAVTPSTCGPPPANSSNGSAATRASLGSSWTASPRSSTSAANAGSLRQPSSGPWCYATSTASSPAATGHPNGPTPTTSSTGSTAAPPTSTTSSCCAATTTSNATKAPGPSTANPTPPSPPPRHPTPGNAHPHADHPSNSPPDRSGSGALQSRPVRSRL